MKLFSLLYLLPATVFSQASSNDLVFTYKGVHNGINVATENRNGDDRQLRRDIKQFVRRNRGLVRTVLRESRKSENRPGRSKLVRFFTREVLRPGRVNFKETTEKIVHFAYKDNQVRICLKNIFIRVVSEYPELVDHFFYRAEQVVKDHPQLSSQVKTYLVNYSRRNPQIYYELFQLIVRLANNWNPDFFSHVFIRIVQVDLASCSRNCRCPNPRYSLQ